jgi:glycosyltransferase involved in cell wall biosynthesis
LEINLEGLVMPKLSVYIPTYNEEDKIAEAIKSVSWADEIVVVDSESTDSTLLIARALGARVVNVPFEGFGKLRNTAIENCSHEWIFSLDADERCTPEVASEIQEILNTPHPADAYYIPRRNWFMGRWIRHSGWYPDYRQPQLFRRGTMVFREEDEVHEGYKLEGHVGYLRHSIRQFPFRNLEQLQAKANRYSSLGAEKLIRRGVKGSMAKAFAHGIAAFLQIYVIKMGFLDGWAGFTIALGSFEGTFYRYAKLAERQSGWEIPPEES